MKFLDTTNKNGLINDCEILLGFSDSGISGNPTLLKQFTGLINRAYDLAVDILLASNTDWEWDDPNYTDYPIVTKDLVASQRDYKLPAASASADFSSFLKLIRVEVMDKDGNYQKLNPFDESETQIGLTSLYPSTGLPIRYREIADAIELYPLPDASFCTLDEGLKIFFQRAQSDFVSTDTTKQPGFASIYHRFLSLQASLDYAATRNMPQNTYIKTLRDEMQAKMTKGVGRRNREVKTKVRPRRTSYV